MWRRITRLLPGAIAAAPLVLNHTAECTKAKSAAAEAQKEAAKKAAQYAEAMAWVKEGGDDKRTPYAASVLLDADGKQRWPLVNKDTLARRLAGTVDNSNVYAKHDALTAAELKDIVEYCGEMNAHGQGIDRSELGERVMEILTLRPILNAGRHYTPLNQNARKILEAGGPQQGWFVDFFARHPQLSERVACSEEQLRAKWMTKAVSLKHFAQLSATLVRAGVVAEDGSIRDARRVLNSDECPNPWQGTGGRSKVIAPVGEPCRKLITAAREHTSLDVAIGLDGHLYGPHVIFAGKTLQKAMVPDKAKVPNSHISVTEKGYQTGGSLLSTLKFWDRDLIRRGVPKPVVWMTDGHSSRLNLMVVRWCRENQWIMYISPPHTTGIHQPLDQIFKSWHTTFNETVQKWCNTHTGKDLDKSTFTALFSEAWSHWTRPDMIVAAFRRCGVTVAGLDAEAVDQKKFVLSETMRGKAPTPALLPAPATLPQLTDSGAGASTDPLPQTRAIAGAAALAVAPATPAAPPPPALLTGEWEEPSPPAGSYRTQTDYWKEKHRLAAESARDLFAQLKTLQQTPLTLKESHPAWQPRVASPTADKAEGRKGLKGIHGDVTDMDGIDLEGTLQKQADNDRETAELREQRKRDMEQRRTEREQEAAAKKSEHQARLELEAPVTELLKHLSFTEPNKDEVSGAELQGFVKANKAQLKALEIDYGKNGSRAKMMPLLLEKLAAEPVIEWARAPPKALPAPAEPAAAAALMLPPPPLERADSPPPTARPERVEALTNSIEKPPEKRNRA